MLRCSPDVKDIRESQLRVKQLERVVRTLKSKQYVSSPSLLLVPRGACDFGVRNVKET